MKKENAKAGNMKQYKGFRFYQVKAYFDKGFNFLNYLKYAVVLLGFDRVLQGDVKSMIIIILAYGIICFVLGFIIYHWRFIEGEKEVQNCYDPFVQEMREFMKSERFK